MSWRKLIVTTVTLTVIALGTTLSIMSQHSAVSLANAEEPRCEYHGIAKDACTRCNPELIPAFKAKNDWCNEHNLPESQCDICNPGLKIGKATQTEAAPSLSQEGASEEHSQAKSANVDWCAEHRVPESQCTKCHPELIEGFKAKHDWCGGHGVPESHCYLCNTGLKFEQEALYNQSLEKAVAIDWCAEHRVPESQCTKCHPELIEGFKAKHDWCGGHGVPESHCYLCNPGLKFEQEAEFKKQQSGQKQSHVPNTSIQRANRVNAQRTML